MRFSIITANYNGAGFLEQAVRSVLEQGGDVELEYIVIDGGSTDGSLDIVQKYRSEIAHCLVESDTGPANAINKGLRLASGDVVAWLNSDDIYYAQALLKVQDALAEASEASMCFGRCAIIDEEGKEIRSRVTRFKELFYPISCRFTYQCINYLSQPSLFFRRTAIEKAGLLREDMVAAWDYDFILRLWYSGPAVRVHDSLAAFRWHESSISSQNYQVQFKEEYEAAKQDAGRFSIQSMFHFLVRWGIVGAYSVMSARRSLLSACR